MSPPTLDQLIRRIVGAAFDAGVDSARRTGAADRAKAREDQVAYAVTILRSNIEAEAARLAKDAA
jgi:hypothetical protein